MDCFKKLNAELQKIKDLGTERSYYPILKEFLIDFAKEHANITQAVNVVSEASSKVHESKVGFPDLTVQVKSYDYQTIGWVEVKLPKDNLNDNKFHEQFSRYTDSLENVLFTNLREWTLYQWDDKGKPKKVEELIFDATNFNVESKALINLLDKFFNGKTLEIKTPKQLALSLARKTRLLSKQVQENLEEAMANNEKENNLIKLKNAFSETLIKDIEPHQFANMAAETMAYSFFLAALEHYKRGNDDRLTLTTAIDYLPDSVPVLQHLYELIGKSAKNHESIKYAVEALIEQFSKADMGKIYGALSKHRVGQDPIINFYEPFLAEYDPQEREARGVYYTPKPVVDYIVKSVDRILKDKFGKVAGIEDRDVYLLDPATGTGTFLMSAIEMIAKRQKRQFGSLGDEIVKKEFCRVTQNHILKHFFGFELMIAPYAIAHLKLTMLLEEFGFDFDMTKDNDDKEDDRLKIYLANTLDEPLKFEEKNQFQIDFDEFTFFQHVSRESKDASIIKSDKPIMVIIGNPPYSNFGQMNHNEWIDGLLKDYKKDLKETKINLDDDYIKFIRFAQWKIERTGEGVMAMITNNSFIEGVTHRQMRKVLMEIFDEIYIYNLHGGIRTETKSPDGEKDENVFDIMTGVSINIFIKKGKLNKGAENCKVFCQDLWGSRRFKLEEVLNNNSIETTTWKALKPRYPYWFFTDEIKEDPDYLEYMSIKNIFHIKGSGVKTDRDELFVDYEILPLSEKIKMVYSGNYSEFFKNKYRVCASSSYKLPDRIKQTKYDDNFIKKINYRPFDERFVYYNPKLVSRPNYDVNQHMISGGNIGLIVTRQFGSRKYFIKFVTDKMSEISSQPYAPYTVMPLWTYDQVNKSIKTTNLNNDFTQNILQQINEKTSNEKLDIQMFDYVYGVLNLPKYYVKYAGQLRIDFPRIPSPSQVIEAKLLNENIKDSEEAFEKISALGNKLRNLHLLIDPVFKDQSVWDVRIGGSKPENLDDWKITKVQYKETEKRVYVNDRQYFEGIEPEVWKYYIGGYQVLDKWLKDRKKAERCLSLDDLIHYMKMVVSIRETVKLLKEV